MSVRTIMEPFKEYMDKWNNNGTPYTLRPDKKNLLSRYETMLFCFEWIERTNGKTIVELGTSRSYTHGGHLGCDKPDDSFWMPDKPEWWDWGSGIFTVMSGLCLGDLGVNIHTVDLVSEHMRRSKLMTSNIKADYHYYVSDSVGFLVNFPGTIDLLYMDTGDAWPPEPTAQLHLQEAMVIVNKKIMSPNGIILIDDVGSTVPYEFGRTDWPRGKAQLSIPYLESNEWKILKEEYQVIMGR